MGFGIRRNLQKIKWNIFGAIFRRFKIQDNKIVVDNFFGRGYGDNPKYIVDEIIAEKPETTIVWLVDKYTDTSLFPKEIRLVKMNSVRSIYEYATAKVWIDNIKNNYKGRKRDGQFYLQTWHGGVGFKKVEREAIETLNPDYVKASIYDSKQIDLMISNSKWVTNNYRENFWYSGKILETGLPRNDVFFKDIEGSRQRVENYFNTKKRIILYAPTFREYLTIEKQIALFSMDYNKLTEVVRNKFGSEYVVIIRVHPNIASYFRIQENEYIKNGSQYPDMQELLVVTDILVTDFSSSMFDFMLKSSRIFLFAPDYEEYVTKDREMKFNVRKDLPFSFSNSEKELLDSIANFDENNIDMKVNEFKKELGICDDGYSSERVAKLLNDIILKGSR